MISAGVPLCRPAMLLPGFGIGLCVFFHGNGCSPEPARFAVSEPGHERCRVVREQVDMRDFSPHTIQEPGRYVLADIAGVTEVDAYPVR